MLAHEVAKKYANGLFLSTQEKGITDLAYDQLEDLNKFLNGDPTLLNFLVAPHVLDEHKLALVKDVFLERIHRLLVELLDILVRKHRIGYLPMIIDEFTRLAEAEKGIGRVTVITAVSLTGDETKRLSTKLASKTGLKIELEAKVEPEIIGGMIVIMHNEIIDSSIRRSLDLIEEKLAKVRVH